MEQTTLGHRVELHAHLDGCARHETLWELSKQKEMELPGGPNGTIEDFKNAVWVHEPRDLEFFLRGFKWIIPPLTDDLAAVRRVALEFCEDAASQGVAYIETRFNPHLFLSGESRELRPEHVVETVCQALKEGEEKFGIQSRALLCCFRPRPDWCPEVAALCARFSDRGVVGIDIAGDEKGGIKSAQEKRSGSMFHDEERLAFSEVGRLGLGRTVHAGEDGPAEAVRQAVQQLGATRIGHGYHTVDDESIYSDCLSRRVHFEACPNSSWHTGSVPKSKTPHPILKFVRDGANFSINRDGSTISMTTLDDEMEVLKSWGLREDHMAKAAFNGARSCFLDKEEKARLIKRLKRAYGVEEE